MEKFLMNQVATEEERTFVPNILSPHLDENNNTLYEDFAIPSRFYQEPPKKVEKPKKLGPSSQFFP